MTLLTAAKYFKHIVPLQLTHNSMRDRLARHYLQIFVTLLRTSAPEHDQMLVFDAVDAMMPYMEVYAGPSASSGSQEGSRVSQPAPIWLNYVRKCMMDYTESPGISSRALQHHHLAVFAPDCCRKLCVAVCRHVMGCAIKLTRSVHLCAVLNDCWS